MRVDSHREQKLLHTLGPLHLITVPFTLLCTAGKNQWENLGDDKRCQNRTATQRHSLEGALTSTPYALEMRTADTEISSRYAMMRRTDVVREKSQDGTQR